MSEQILYLPKVLFERQPVGRAAISGADISGELLLYPFQGGSLLQVAVRGLADGFHGLHIHESGECKGDFSTAGVHWNPAKTDHPAHTGDLPALLSFGTFAYMIVYTGRFTPEEARGRTVIVHDMGDDYHSQPAGNAGARIACGVIQPVAP